MRIASIAAAALLAFPGMSSAANLWSTDNSHLGPGLFFGPGAYEAPTKLFAATIRNMAFHTDVGFITPFFNNGSASPNLLVNGLKFDGVLADGSLVNENVQLEEFVVAGMKMQPFVANNGAFRGEQITVTEADGDVIMTMDLVLDMGIGERGIIAVPFYGTTGTLKIPPSLQTAGGAQGVDQAGRLKSGDIIAGRIGDFNGDGYIDGTLVAVGNMPMSSPVFPGQPYALSRNFETDIALDGTIMGSAFAIDQAYNNKKGEPTQ